MKPKAFFLGLSLLCFTLKACASNDTSLHSLKDINEFGTLQKKLLSYSLSGTSKKTNRDMESYHIKAFNNEIAIEISKKHSIPGGINSIFIDGKNYKLTSDNKYLLIDNLAIYSLEINKSKFICIYSGYTPCNSYNCRKVRFNLFEITDSITNQFSFDNVFGDVNIFGDANKDGYLDFLSTAFSDNPSNEPTKYYDYMTISVASIVKGKLEELKNGKTKYFMDVKFDPEKSGQFKEFRFDIIASNWFRN